MNAELPIFTLQAPLTKEKMVSDFEIGVDNKAFTDSPHNTLNKGVEMVTKL